MCDTAQLVVTPTSTGAPTQVEMHTYLQVGLVMPDVCVDLLQYSTQDLVGS